MVVPRRLQPAEREFHRICIRKIGSWEISDIFSCAGKLGYILQAVKSVLLSGGSVYQLEGSAISPVFAVRVQCPTVIVRRCDELSGRSHAMTALRITNPG